MKRFFLLSLCSSSLLIAASPEVPFQRPEEREKNEQQSAKVFQITSQLIASAKASTVWVWSNSPRPSAIGTVIGDGRKILTKWSEIAHVARRAPGSLFVADSENRPHRVKATHISEEDDLVVLELLDDVTLPALRWSDKPAPELGQFLVGVQPNGYPAGIGVVSVNERSLRNADQAAIGILADPTYREKVGVRIAQVTRDSAAYRAKLQAGDVVTHIHQTAINGIFELRGTMATLQPQQTVEVQYIRDGETKKISLVLDHRTWNDDRNNQRLREMEHLGGEISRVGENFPSAIQTDMPLSPQQCGAPVLDLEGNAVGILIARSDRTRSFFIPAAYLTGLLRTMKQADGKAQAPEKPIPKATEVR